MIDFVKAILPVAIAGTFIYLLCDYAKLRLIKYRKIGEKYWHIAFSEREFELVQDGSAQYEVIMPPKPLAIRIYRKIFPLKGVSIGI